MLPDFRLATAPEICAELGERLRAQRLALNVTQQELATRSGVALNAIKKLESDGQTTLATLVRASMALGLAAELDVFQRRVPASIAELERTEGSPRHRARRKTR